MSKTNLLSAASSGQQWANPILPVRALPDTRNFRVAPPIKNKSKAEKLSMFDKFCRLINKTEAEVFAEFARQATALGYTINTYKDDWVIAHHVIEGIKPLFITAHVDTVRPDYKKIRLCLDRNRWCFQADKSGIIGADDRGGCLIILELLAAMQGKSVIFALFNYEEGGGGFGMHGSSLFADLTDEPLLANAKLFIGLDRHGFDEYVTYDYDNSEVDNYLKHYGYTKDYGSFSDVTHLANATRTACINMSAGFTDEHSIHETGWLYPIFRAIETIPLLYNTLGSDNYLADEEEYIFSNYDDSEELIEFMDDLKMFGTTCIRGYTVSVENVYFIVKRYIESQIRDLESKLPQPKSVTNKHCSEPDPEQYTTQLPF